jgi:hypothetical protein
MYLVCFVRDSHCVLMNCVSLQLKQLTLPKKETSIATEAVDAIAAVQKCLEVYVSTTDEGYAGKEEKAQSSTDAVPTSFLGLSRLELGHAILQAGENYKCVVLLAAAQLALTSTLAGATDTLAELKQLSGDLAALNGIDVNGAMPKSSQALSTVDAARRERYVQECGRVLSGVNTLLQALETMQLQSLYPGDDLAPLAGKDLKAVLTGLPQSGPIYQEVRAAVCAVHALCLPMLNVTFVSER